MSDPGPEDPGIDQDVDDGPAFPDPDRPGSQIPRRREKRCEDCGAMFQTGSSVRVRCLGCMARRLGINKLPPALAEFDQAGCEDAIHREMVETAAALVRSARASCRRTAETIDPLCGF